MKFLYAVMGIDGFNFTFCCLWCKCPSKDRWNMETEWSMSDVNKGARTVEDIVECANERAKKIRFNCFSSPLFPSIPVTKVVLDTLHLFLRVADELRNQLLAELKLQDNLKKSCSRKELS